MTARLDGRALRDYPRKKKAAAATAALSLLGAVALFVPPAYAVLNGVSTTKDATTGLPDYYQDSTGLRLTACDDGTAACAGVTKADYAADTTGAIEDFYNLAQSVITGPTITGNHAGVKLTSVLAVEAIHDPEGLPDAFQRIRSRVQLGAPNATYQVIEPFGTQTITTNAAGTGTTTQDIGCAGLANDPPCDFSKALANGFSGAAGSLGPFIQWDTGAPAGYVGDGATTHAIKGSPTGHNLFQVTGPGLQNGNPSNSGTLTSTLYTVTGKIAPTAAAVALSPTSLTFGSQNIGTTSAAQTVTVTNTGTANLNVTGVTAGSTDFAQTNTCTAAVAPNATCTIAVTFAPGGTTAGGRSATLAIADNAADSPQVVSLSGTAALAPPTSPAVTLSPASETFASQNVGTTSAAQTVTVKNTGTASLSVTGVTSSSAEFPQTNTCTAAIAPNGTCTIAVKFAPVGAAGARSGTISIADNAADSPQVVNLSGTAAVVTTPPPPPPPPPVPGIAITCPAACTTLGFGSNSLLFGAAGVLKVITVTSTGTAPLIVSAVAIAGTQATDFTISASTCTPLPKTVATSCQISVKFRTKGIGARAATLSIASNASATAKTVALTGSGSL